MQVLELLQQPGTNHFLDAIDAVDESCLIVFGRQHFDHPWQTLWACSLPIETADAHAH